MGSCCTNEYAIDPSTELGSHPETTLKGITYSSKQIWMIIRIQTNFRGYMARKKVKVLREERALQNPFFASATNMTGNFENAHVKVSRAICVDSEGKTLETWRI
jgi:hypothetical protein